MSADLARAHVVLPGRISKFLGWSLTNVYLFVPRDQSNNTAEAGVSKPEVQSGLK